MNPILDLPLATLKPDELGVLAGDMFLLGRPVIHLKLQPIVSTKGQTYYKAFASDGGIEQEVGVGFSKVARNGKPFIKLFIDNPVLPASFIGYLFEDPATKIHTLKWSRESHLDPEQQSAAAPVQRSVAPNSPAL